MNVATKPLEGITEWVFDLDNTLYPRTCELFAQIDVLITEYVMKLTGLERTPARKLQKDYYRDFGTTLNGLMHTHGIDPLDYLSFVHDIDYSPVAADPELVAAIQALPGRKVIFTNADRPHAENVLSRLGASDLFADIYDICAHEYAPKPEEAAYRQFLKLSGIAPAQAVMFDDLEKNLRVPHALGMRTVHVVAEDGFAHDHVEDWELAANRGAEHIHFVTNDLVRFLSSQG